MNSNSSTVLEWKLSQVLGEREPGEEILEDDIISCIEFDKKGEYFATGDYSGRIVIFEKKDGKTPHQRKELEQLDHPDGGHPIPIYGYKIEFQSHEPEFDYLHSLEIGEKINKVKWYPAANDSMMILSTNDKTIKLWKISERKVKKLKEMDPNPPVCPENELLAEKSFMPQKNEPSVLNGYRLEWRKQSPKDFHLPFQCDLPTIATTGKAAPLRCQRLYAHAHNFNINSISINSDGETYISADDLRINLWNLEVNDQCFNIIDMKPKNMEDLTEVITSAEFHPICCNLLAYGSSRGFIRLVDMRQSALCDHNSRIFCEQRDNGSKSFFTEIVTSVSDIKFAKSGRYILTRDYMDLKLWDINMESSPVAVFKIHEHLRPKLPELYDDDSIFDKFDCCMGGDDLHFATGSYSNWLGVFSTETECQEITLDINKDLPWKKVHHHSRKLKIKNSPYRHQRREKEYPTPGTYDFTSNLTQKLLHLAWHPISNLIACASANSLYLYHA